MPLIIILNLNATMSEEAGPYVGLDRFVCRQALLSQLEEEGLLVLELKGGQKEYDRGINFLLKSGIKIQSLSQDVTRNEERCTHCGACITVCPSGAFELEPQTRRVKFDNEKCIVCGLCIKACPPRAMEVHF